MLNRVWHIFQQADRSLDRSQGGLGIGLSIVRMLIELHGGTVEARSRGLGHGSTFIVWLPIAEDDAARAPDEPARPAPPAPSHDPSRQLRVLVVDDNVDAATTLGDLVRSQGHEVRVVHDGVSALTAAEAQHPDVVFLDIGLPGMDGYAVARAIRADAANEGMCLIALTGWGQEGDRERTRGSGFDHHLTKPVDLGALRRLLAGRARACQPMH
jgi:CheY-like chemotaxis protein